MSQKLTDTETTFTECTFPRCECMVHPDKCVFKSENQIKHKKHKPFKGLLDQWYKVYSPVPSPYDGMEHLGFVIRGVPVGHPDFENWMQTSLVVWIDEHETCIETLNSRYALGTKLEKQV